MRDDASKASRNRFLLILGIFAIPIVVSYLAYYVWQPEPGKLNYGELIAPVTLADDLMLARADGTPLPLKALRGKWLLLYASSGACDARCEATLYAMRQVRTMQGRERERVLRVWLLTDASAPSAELARNFDGTLLVRDPAGALLAQLPARAPLADHLYIIDPLGNVMMRYTGDLDIKRLSKDIARLLKASQIG